MQTGYEVSSLSVPVISRISDWAVCYKKPRGFISDWLHVQGVATPFYMFKGQLYLFFTMAKGSTTPFSEA